MPTMDYEELIREKNAANTVENIPIIVYMSVVCTAGIVGNFVALLFYVQKTDKSVATIVLMTLSGNDFICSIVLLVTIYGLVHSITYTNVAACKVQGFLNHVFVINSLILLLILALERYFTICKVSRLKKLFERRKRVVYIILGVAVFSILLSAREVVFFDVGSIEVSRTDNVTIIGNHCMITKEARFATIVTVFNIIDFVCIIVNMISMLSFYVLIIRKISSVGKRHRARQNEIASDLSLSTEISDISVSVVKQATNENKVKGNNKAQRPKSIHVSSTNHWSFTIERRLTQMAFILTLVSVLSFVPYFAVSVIAQFRKELPIWTRILYRSYALNSTLNPYLIGFYSAEFRAFIKNILTCRFLPCLKRN